MSKIDTENAKTVRQALDVHVGLSYTDTSAPITNITSSYNTALHDTNMVEALTNTTWKLCNLADLSVTPNQFNTPGFVLNPNDVPELVVPNHVASAANGKYGFRTALATENSTLVDRLTITSTGDLYVLTLHIPQGGGHLTVTGSDTWAQYPIQEYVYIQCHGEHSINIQINNASEEERIIIDYIISGLYVEWTNDDLVSCTLDLRSDLSMDNPTWQVSGIDVSVYFPQDMSALISCIQDDTPIWYYAGYDDEQVYSPTRYFYLSDKIAHKDNVITIKGEDISHKLADFNIVPTILSSDRGSEVKNLYNQLATYIESQVGITLINKEAAPSGTTTGNIEAHIVKNCSVREWVADVMNLARNYDADNFYPRFVDAGIPSLAWSKPTSQWDIYEEDVTDLQIEVERTIKKLDTEDEHGLLQSVNIDDVITTLQENNVTAGQNYSFSDGDYYYAFAVTNGTLSNKPTKTNAAAAEFTATATGTSVLTGRKAIISGNTPSLQQQRAGITLTMKPLTYQPYFVYNGSTIVNNIYPNYGNLFYRSTITGSFTFRGDVRMQPRDVFTFHRMNGSTEVCTIENIKLKHENGGTEAEITYRKGVV